MAPIPDQLFRISSKDLVKQQVPKKKSPWTKETQEAIDRQKERGEELRRALQGNSRKDRRIEELEQELELLKEYNKQIEEELDEMYQEMQLFRTGMETTGNRGPTENIVEEVWNQPVRQNTNSVAASGVSILPPNFTRPNEAEREFEFHKNEYLKMLKRGRI